MFGPLAPHGTLILSGTQAERNSTGCIELWSGELDLSENPLGTEGAKELAKALSSLESSWYRLLAAEEERRNET